MPPSAFLTMLGGAAQDCMRRTGVPASITLAQAALESSWGKDTPGCNLFGIKADISWRGPVVLVDTHEYIKGVRTAVKDPFRAYSSWLDSMLDHAKFLQSNPRYHDCFKQIDGAGWARALQAAGYATDPDYAKKLISIMRDYNLAVRDQVHP
jgi:flagellar rod assembly protein/muramidase FlgJ